MTVDEGIIVPSTQSKTVKNMMAAVNRQTKIPDFYSFVEQGVESDLVLVWRNSATRDICTAYTQTHTQTHAGHTRVH